MFPCSFRTSVRATIILLSGNTCAALGLKSKSNVLEKTIQSIVPQNPLSMIQTCMTLAHTARVSNGEAQ